MGHWGCFLHAGKNAMENMQAIYQHKPTNLEVVKFSLILVQWFQM